MRTENLVEWESDDFTLHIHDNPEIRSNGRVYFRYTFWDKAFSPDPLFEGEEYSPSPLYSWDDPQVVSSLLSFLSLGEHDTDDEYFEDYTPEQLEWRDSARREELEYEVYDLEEGEE